MKKAIFSGSGIITCCMLMMSCSSVTPTPQTIYYLLDADPAAPAMPITTVTNYNGAVERVMINNISLPDYLSTNQLVMQEDGHTLLKANYHRWADSLDDAIQRALIDDLNNMSNDVEFVQSCGQCISIDVTIEHFYPSTTGKMLFSGYFEQRHLLNNNTDSIKLTRFHFLEKLTSSGYANSVEQMRLQVNELAKVILMQLPK